MGEWATGSECYMAAGFLLGVMKALWNQIMVMVHSIVNVVNATKLYSEICLRR